MWRTTNFQFKKLTLVYHSGALGDFITTLPAIQHLAYQNGPIVMVGKPEYSKLKKEIFLKVYDCEGRKMTPLFSNGNLDHIDSTFLTTMKQIGKAILFIRKGSPIPDNFMKLGLKKIRTFEVFPRMRQPKVLYHLASVGAKSSWTSTPSSTLLIPEKPSKKYHFLERKYVVIAPGSGSYKKNWPLKNYFAIAERLREDFFCPVWLLGPAENGWEKLQELRDEIIISDVSITEAASIIGTSRLYIGNDSGTTHLAASVGCPTLALFGPFSDKIVWAPWGKNTVLLSTSENENSKPTLEDLTINKVYKACFELLSGFL